MITIDGKEYRNLQEQVAKNKSDIYDFRNLGIIGIKVVGQVNASSDLPASSTEYGDAYLVGTETPFEYYVWTRANDDTPTDHWFNIGFFPLPGPQGDKGNKGDKGDTGNTGATGATGAQGIQGIPGTAATIQMGTVTTLAAGSPATATNVGTSNAAIINLGLPQGPKGDPGSSTCIKRETASVAVAAMGGTITVTYEEYEALDGSVAKRWYGNLYLDSSYTGTVYITDKFWIYSSEGISGLKISPWYRSIYPEMTADAFQHYPSHPQNLTGYIFDGATGGVTIGMVGYIQAYANVINSFEFKYLSAHAAIRKVCFDIWGD